MTHPSSRLCPLAAALLTLSGGCATKAPAQEAAGILTIGVSTTGSGAAALSFPVEIKSTGNQVVFVTSDGGIATVHDLPDGPYVVQLTLPTECQATNGDSRQISIAPRRTTAVRFVVACR